LQANTEYTVLAFTKLSLFGFESTHTGAAGNRRACLHFSGLLRSLPASTFCVAISQSENCLHRKWVLSECAHYRQRLEYFALRNTNAKCTF